MSLHKENQIHISIPHLEGIIETAKELRKSNPSLTDVVVITKTAARQFPGLEDKFEVAILTELPSPIIEE